LGKPSGEGLQDATPDGLRRSAFMGAFAERITMSGTVDLKAVGRKPSGERLQDATPDGLENGWINRFGIGNESVLKRRSS